MCITSEIFVMQCFFTHIKILFLLEVDDIHVKSPSSLSALNPVQNRLLYLDLSVTSISVLTAQSVQ